MNGLVDFAVYRWAGANGREEKSAERTAAQVEAGDEARERETHTRTAATKERMFLRAEREGKQAEVAVAVARWVFCSKQVFFSASDENMPRKGEVVGHVLAPGKGSSSTSKIHSESPCRCRHFDE